MVIITLGDKLNIEGLEDWERPLHLLRDSEGILYFITGWDRLSKKPKNSPINKLFMGREGKEMEISDKITRCECLRDGGTTYIDFVHNSEAGKIYVAPFSHPQSKLEFKGETKKLEKVGYDSAYLFNTYPR